MKKLLLGFFMAASIPTFSQFYGATVTEDPYPNPAADAAWRSHHSSAYSYMNVPVGSNSYDLYTYSWDAGSLVTGSPIPGSGFAIRQYLPGAAPGSGTAFSQFYNPSGFPAGDAASIEVMLLRRGSDILALTAYYQVSTQKYMLNLFRWNGTALIQESGYPVDITVNGPTVDFEWIRMDALTLDKFILTWSEHGRIYTKAGKAGSGLAYGNTARLNAGDQEYDQVDVALIDVLEGEPQQVKAHYVYTTTDHQKLFVGGLLFDDVYSATPGASLTPVSEDAQTTTGEYLLPRIDAPDKYATDDWSYVVEEQPTPTNRVITAGVMHQPVLTHRDLNNNTAAGFPAFDLSPWPNSNTKPVVAYAAGGEDIYYCWGYKGDYPTPPLPYNYTLIGLKMDNSGNFLSPPSPFYSLVPTIPDRVSPALSIALSGNNMNSPGLFMVFAQVYAAGGGTYTMGTKVTPWSNNYFRPLDLEEQEQEAAISVYPNPFSAYVQLLGPNPEDKLEVRLYDALGRQLLYTSANLAEVNQNLQKHSNDLAAGNYFLYIVGDKEQPVVFKLSKTN